MVMAEKISAKELEKLPPEKRIAVLKKLEETRKKEIQKAEELIRSSEKEIVQKKEKEQELEEKSREITEKRAPAEHEELEEIVEEAQKSPANAGPFQPKYGAPLEEIKKLYEIATPEVYNGVMELRNRAAEGRLTEDDERRISSYERQFSQVSDVNAQYVNDRHARENLMKMKTALGQIEEYKLMW